MTRPPRREDSPELSRRDLLRAIGFGSVAFGLAGCGAPLNSAVPSGVAQSGASPSDGSTAGAPSSLAPSSSAASPGASSGSPPPGASPSPVPSAVVGLSVREKIGRLLVAGFHGTTVSKSSPVGKAIAAGELGGVILFDLNIVSPSQLADLTASLAALAPDTSPLIVAVDQEGGTVQRLGPAHGFPDVPSQEAVGARDATYAASVYGAMAITLSDAGINLNLAPVVDVDVNRKNPAVGALNRSFSADPATVAAMARVAIEAQHGHGVLTTIKHFPGLGSASANTDFTVVDVTKTWSDAELVPYDDLVATGTADCVMVGHINNKTLDAKYPSSLSKATIEGLLRGQLGWQGPVITDDIQAAAITKRYKRIDAITLALNAGVDLLLVGSAGTDPAFYSALVDSIERQVTAGKIPEGRIDEAVTRIAEMRAQL